MNPNHTPPHSCLRIDPAGRLLIVHVNFSLFSFRLSAPTHQVLDRWQKLKLALIEKRSKLGEHQSLQQFSRDGDEIEAWISEKLQAATDETYKEPANIQSKHQKHQAFEAELAANADR